MIVSSSTPASRAGGARGRRTPSRARHGRPRARRRRRAAFACSRSARSIQRSTSIVFAKTRTRSGSAPRATTESRAAEPTTSTLAAPRIDRRGTTASFTARRHAGARAEVVALDDAGRTEPGALGTRRSRPATANVLQPETTTTSGCAARSAREDARRERVVVAQQRRRTAARDARGGRRPRWCSVDRPVAAGDGPRGVDHGEVDVVARRDAVEERRPVRRRLGRDDGDAGHDAPPRADERAERRSAHVARRGRAALERARAAAGTRAARRAVPGLRAPTRQASSASTSGATRAISRSATWRWNDSLQSPRRCDACAGMDALQHERLGRLSPSANSNSRVQRS